MPSRLSLAADSPSHFHRVSSATEAYSVMKKPLPTNDNQRSGPRAHPRAPSLRPPSSLRAQRRDSEHKVYVELAALQMARVRQRRIRDALSEQVDRCTRRIEQIEQESAALKAHIERTETSSGAPDADGFEYRY